MNTNETTYAQTLNNIQTALLAGKTVIVATYTKATKFTKPEHTSFFKATSNGCYMAQGKNWVCINYCAIQISR